MPQIKGYVYDIHFFDTNYQPNVRIIKQNNENTPKKNLYIFKKKIFI